ncbi:alpha/beta fold hydrolase [Nocardia rhizosphaerihabitans]|uniref:Lipase n=1 Tax=Nocardia rhizosphaerihabitans TaxID=1691570 RepID=A0ABQ2KA66_9NOCA|nr:alpha/beta fold hydrolase [Nocardia rhizosphaerihabitans]GGN74410.1 lipase [Nocardia rhizosphaerihabitans]
MRGVSAWRLAAAAAVLSTGIGVCAPMAHADAPGTVIAVIPQADGFHGMSGAQVIDYWTQGVGGVPQPASGALYLPEGDVPAGGWPVIAYDHGTTGLGAGCGGQSDPAGAPWPESQAAQDVFLRHLVAQGYAVVAPDYLGLGRFDTGPHPYLGIDTEATATLDLLRAARSVRSDLSPVWVAAGMSQGGQAALGTGHRQASYAPELDFRGTIAIDPESDVEKVAPLLGPGNPDRVSGGILGFSVSILAGLRAARPDAQVDNYLTPLGRQVIDEIGTLCQDAIDERVADLTLGQLLSRPLSEEPLRSVMADYMTVPTSGYDAPILLLVNATDRTVPSPLHAALAAQFTANGVNYTPVVGTGKHCELNQAMIAAIDEFLARAR